MPMGTLCLYSAGNKMILPCWLHGIFEVRAEAQPEASGIYIVGYLVPGCMQ
jgi:hypothetical protein